MAVDLVWFGVPEFGAALGRAVERASLGAREAVAEMAAELEKDAKRRASGRPGPNVITGTLRRGIVHEPITPWGLRGWKTGVGPTVIYSRRIELGFHGADRLGRVYNQPGYPYFVPAFRSLMRRAEGIYAKHWSAALTSL